MSGLPVRELRLVAAPGEADLGPLGPYRTWMYNGRFPGEEIRVAEGHSHSALQLDRGMLGPLIIEEGSSHVDYDREYTIMLDDLLVGEPRLIEGGRSMMMGMGSAGPDYDAFLINGRPAADPAVLDLRRGEQVRLRLINPASQTTFRGALTGHRGKVIHADSRPVEPVEVDAVLIGMGERYDVLVAADNRGAWNLVASSVERQSARRAPCSATRTPRRTHRPRARCPPASLEDASSRWET